MWTKPTSLIAAQLAACGGFLHVPLFVEITPPLFSSSGPFLSQNAELYMYTLIELTMLKDKDMLRNYLDVRIYRHMHITQGWVGILPTKM